MANKFQFKRTSVSGRTPNTTNSSNGSFIDAGEFAVNLTDKKLYSSDGSAYFEVGANLASLSVTGTAVLKAISANGTLGIDSQVLTTNGSAVYWGAGGAGGTGKIAGSGLTSNASHYEVLANTGIIANNTGTYVDSTYIATITANNANYLQTKTWEAPGTIGSTTANSGSFTLLTASANLNVDNGTLFVDAVNNRVGIGSATPAGEALDVRGNIRLGGADAGPNYIAFRGTTGDSPGTYNHTYVGERIHTATESSELLLFKGNDPSASGPDRVRIAASEFRVDTYSTALSGDFETVASNTTALTNKFIVTNSGNVGIGNTSPGAKLHVQGDAIVANSTANVAYFASNGNVGIGTGAPTNKLHVNGTGFASNDFRAPIFYDSDNTGYYVDPNGNTNLYQINNVTNAPGNLRDNLGAPSTEELALFHGQFNNKFRFISPTSQEESTDGTTWTTSTRATSAQLGDMMIGEGIGTGFAAIPASTIGTYGGYRLTWDVVGTAGYVHLNHLYLYGSTQGNQVTMLIEAYHNTNGWTTIASGSYNNWPGHTTLKHTTIPYSNNAVQYSKVRVTLSTTRSNTNSVNIYAIEWFGGYPAGKRNVESYDRNKNVTFPAGIAATGPLTGVTTAAMGNTTITGDLSVTGNTTLGDASSDKITINANTITITANASIDAGTLYINSVNDRVGIGNTAPASKLTIQDTLTANASSTVEINPTWNATANTFTAVKVNVIDTASNTNSLLMDLQVGGSSRIAADKNGRLLSPLNSNSIPAIATTAAADRGFGFYANRPSVLYGGAVVWSWQNAQTMCLGSATNIAWTSGNPVDATVDLFIGRDAGNVLAQRNSTNAQTFRVYGTYTDASNHERVSLSANGSGAYLLAEEAGTGIARDLFLGANNTSRVTVSANGNVGIGTTTPATALHIPTDFSNVRVGQSAATDVRFSLVTANTANGWNIRLQSATGSLTFDEESIAPRLIIAKTTGNVGIGNTSPANKLFVTGDIGLDGISVRDTATTTTTATTQVTLFEYPIATYDSCDVIVKAVSGGARHTTKLLVTANSTVAIATEYGTLQTGSSLFTVDVDVNASNTRIRITPASATSTVFKSSYELITA